MTSRSQQVKKSIKTRQTRRLLAESLENRQLMAVDTIMYADGLLTLRANNSPTHVELSMVGSNVRLTEGATVRDIPAPGLTQIRFHGGSASDYFRPYISTLQKVVAYGNGGDDVLHGSGLHDVLYGGEGSDRLFGWGGNDELLGGNGDDKLEGHGGNDSLYGEAGIDTIKGGVGNDRVWAGIGDDYVYGGDGDDQLHGQDGNDYLYGEAGNDVVTGGYGIDRLYGGDGNDHLDGQYNQDFLYGEAGNDVLVSIDSAFSDDLFGGTGADTFWMDYISSTQHDDVYGQETIDRAHRVGGFANGADRTLNGDRIADPSFHYDRFWLTEPYEYRQFSNIELFDSNGPTADDVRQGGVGDCVLLSTLASIADRAPNAIRERIVDFRDGTYGVLVGGKYFRVDNDLPVWKDFESLVYAQMSDVQSMWVAIFEKAYAIYKGNSYSSINGLNAESVFRDFQMNSIGWHWASSFNTAASLANRIDTLLRSGNQVLIGSLDRFPGDTGTVRESSPLVRNHAYSVMRVVKNSSGVITGIVVRNPWGSDGGTATGDTSDGLVTLTPAQLLRYTETITYGKV